MRNDVYKVVHLYLLACLCSLPYVMGLMPNLKSVMLDGNPLRTLRRDIVQVSLVSLVPVMVAEEHSEA